jgi:hypothetical protein
MTQLYVIYIYMIKLSDNYIFQHTFMRNNLPFCTRTHMHASLSEVYQVGSEVGTVFDSTWIA